MAQSIVLLVQENPQYRDGKPEDRSPVSAETRKAWGKRKPKNFQSLVTPEDGVVGHLVTRARPRRVVFVGDGMAMTSTDGNARSISRVAMSAPDAARIVGLSAEETAAFVSRFPASGLPAGKPQDANAIAAVFRKVNAWRGKIDIAPSASVETLS